MQNKEQQLPTDIVASTIDLLSQNSDKLNDLGSIAQDPQTLFGALRYDWSTQQQEISPKDYLSKVSIYNASIKRKVMNIQSKTGLGTEGRATSLEAHNEKPADGFYISLYEWINDKHSGNPKGLGEIIESITGYERPENPKATIFNYLIPLVESGKAEKTDYTADGNNVVEFTVDVPKEKHPEAKIFFQCIYSGKIMYSVSLDLVIPTDEVANWLAK